MQSQMAMMQKQIADSPVMKSFAEISKSLADNSTFKALAEGQKTIREKEYLHFPIEGRMIRGSSSPRMLFWLTQGFLL